VNADLLIAQHIDAALPELQLGQNLFVGPVRAADESGGIEHQAVFVLTTGGLFSEPLRHTGKTIYRPSVQIRIRSGMEVGAFQCGQDLANRIFYTVDQNPPADLCETRSFDSQPSYLGLDDDGHHEWSINVGVLMVVQVQDVYWGLGAAGGSGEAFVLALSNSARLTSRNKDFPITAGAADKIYYAIPQTFGAPTFTVGALPGGFFLADSPTVNGIAYDLWESDNIGLGAVTVSVT
jgi:hypothetical protein